KGRAADLVVEELLDRDVRGVCVNLGGDLRVAGEAPDGGEAWAVGLEEPDDPDTTWGVVGLRDGALATSSTTRRRWSAADGTTRHHLIDPRTGAPATAPLQSVTVIAASAMEAEVHARASPASRHTCGEQRALVVRRSLGRARRVGGGARVGAHRPRAEHPRARAA